MSYTGISIRLLAIFICVFAFTKGSIVSRLRRQTETETKCEELDNPSWSIDSLKSAPVDTWPWSCLNARYTNDSLHEGISSVNVFDAASKGYLGFVQYYAEKKNVDLLQNREKSYKSPLTMAIANGHLNVVRYIAPRALKGQDSILVARSLLEFAVFFGHMDIIKYMLEELKLEDMIKDQTFTLVMAIRSGNLATLKYFVEERKYTLNKDYGIWLSWAVESGNIDVLKYLVHEKNITKYSGPRNDLALHFAAGFGDLEMVKFLIDNLHYEVDAQDEIQETPVYFAAQEGRLLVLKYLIEEKKGSLEVKNKGGNTLLHVAAGCGRREDIAENMLIDYRKNDWWKRQEYQDIRENALDTLERERDSLRPKGDFEDGAIMRYLIDDHKLIDRINEVNDLKQTPALKAAHCGQLATLKYLLDEKQANAKTLDWQGRNLLHVAIIGNRLPVVQYLIEEKGFDVNEKTSDGQTGHDLAKEYAATPDDRSLMTELLQKKKDEVQKL